MFRYLSALFENFYRARKTLLFVNLFVFALGILLGCLYLHLFAADIPAPSAEEFSAVYDLLKNRGELGFFELYFLSFFDALKTLGIMFLSAITVAGLPITFLALGYKGFSIGVMSTTVFKIFFQNALALNIYLILPQSILIVPLLMLFSCECADFSICLWSMIKGSKKFRGSFEQTLLVYLIKSVLFLALLAALCFIQTLIIELFLYVANSFLT